MAGGIREDVGILASGLPATSLIVEITETALVANPEAATKRPDEIEPPGCPEVGT